MHYVLNNSDPVAMLTRGRTEGCRVLLNETQIRQLLSNSCQLNLRFSAPFQEIIRSLNLFGHFFFTYINELHAATRKILECDVNPPKAGWLERGGKINCKHKECEKPTR